MGLIEVTHGNVYQFTTLGTTTVNVRQIAGTQEVYNKHFLTGLTASGSVLITGSLNVNGNVYITGSTIPIDTAWTSYTPQWSTDGVTQPVIGNGSISGAYKQIGKTVFVRVRLYYGTTTTSGTGTFYFSLPITASATWGIQMPVSILDNGNAWYQAIANGEYGGFTTKTALIGQSAGGANSSQGITGTFPFTFGNLDSIQFNGSYEAS